MTRRCWGSHKGRDAGFTLVEAMVSLLLAGVVMLLAHEALKAGGRLVDLLSYDMRWSAEMQKAERVLRLTIPQAYPAVLSDHKLGYRLSFNGTQSSLEFSTMSLSFADGPGLFHVRLEVEDASLYMRWRQERGADDVLSSDLDWRERVLLSPVRDVNFRYWGASDSPGRAAAKLSWSGQKKLPLLVEIAIHTVHRGADAPVIFRFSPGISTDGACRYDIMTSGCRGRS